MGMVDVFTARDLRNNAGGLLRDAAAGKLSLITKHGRPAALAVPFDERLLTQGVHRSLAIRLLSERLLTLKQAARIASLSIEEFLDVLAETEATVVDYPAKELRAETEHLR